MLTRTYVVVTALVIVAGGLGALLGGCGGDGSAGQTGTLQLLLTDAPAADIAEVHVHIVSVQVVGGGAGVVEVIGDGDIPDDIELVSLAQDAYLLGAGIIPAGEYQQMRLILSQVPGENWLRTATDEVHELTVPSGGQTGIKLVTGPFTVAPDLPTILLLDFDAAASVHRAGASGNWIMRPVIHASVVADVEPLLGSLVGTVTDNDGNPLVAAEGELVGVFLLDDEGEVVAVVEVSPDDGTFEIPSILAGDYTLRVFYASIEWDPIGDALLVGVDGGAASDSFALSIGGGQTLSLNIVLAP